MQPDDARPAFSPTVRAERIVVDDGVGLAAVVAGDPDAPGLLLVPGFGGAKEDFADHVDALARDHRVASFDHRGHGESDQPDDPGAYSLDRLGADVRAVARELGLRDLRLLGHSMGGMVVRRAVLQDRDVARALVFMDTSAGVPPGIEIGLVRVGVEVVRSSGMATLRQLQDELDLMGSAAHRRVLDERVGFREYMADRWRSLSPVMWSTLAVEIAVQPDELDALRAVDVPTLVIVGNQDLQFLGPSRAIASTVPGARLVEIPEAGHSPQFENAAAWRHAIVEFLASLSPH
ncbi:MAG: alpha/beta fold hydrolase [Acidimicrobiia bacterium]